MLAQTSKLLHKQDCVLSSSRFHLTGRPVPFTNVRRVHSTKQTAKTVCMSTVAAPAKLDVQTLDGSAVGTEELALKVAGDSARGLVHRYLVTVRQNARSGTASTKTRSEVRGGGRKPFKQKGTGNARMGSKRSPLIPGGGVVFGPKPRDWSIKMNKKEKRLAMSTAIQSAADSIVVVEDFKDKFTEIKTKKLADALKTWGVSQKDHALIIMSEMNEVVYKSGRNIDGLEFNTINGLKVYDILRADKIIIEQSALEYVKKFYGAEAEAESDA